MLTLPQQLEARQLYGLIPHQGAMMLLDRVERWDDRHVICSAISHLDEGNPLKIEGRLSYVHVIEYGAQATAIHLALNVLETGAPLPGYTRMAPISLAYLAITRDFRFEEGYLDSHPGTRLIITAHRALVGPRIYRYHVTGDIDGRTVAEGMISLVTEDIDLN